jgi:hypothetical protein
LPRLRPRNDFVGLPRLRAETCRYGVQAGTFQVLACLPQAGNDRMGKGFHSLNRNLGDLLTTFLLSINLILVMVDLSNPNTKWA